jgi:hypothetical protein
VEDRKKAPPPTKQFRLGHSHSTLPIVVFLSKRKKKTRKFLLRSKIANLLMAFVEMDDNGGEWRGRVGQLALEYLDIDLQCPRLHSLVALSLSLSSKAVTTGILIRKIASIFQSTSAAAASLEYHARHASPPSSPFPVAYQAPTRPQLKPQTPANTREESKIKDGNSVVPSI